MKDKFILIQNIFSHVLLFIVFLIFLFNHFNQLNAQEFDQPVNFSHKTHAGDNEIPCEFCHIYARRSNSSGVPSMQSCVGCHKVIKGATQEQQDEINKLMVFWDKKEVIPWKKIHDVPDFVYFSHKRHIKAGFDCTECHGDISQIAKITMANMNADLSMGWCAQCHQTPHPVINKKIVGPVRLTRGGKIISEANNQQPDTNLVGSNDCFVCHK